MFLFGTTKNIFPTPPLHLMMVLSINFVNGLKNFMNKSFSELSKLYLEPNGIIKKEGKKLFLASLPASRQSSRKTLFREWFGPHVKWKHLTSGIFSGDSGDSVTKIITDTEIY